MERVDIPVVEVRRTSESLERMELVGGEFMQADISASMGETWRVMEGEAERRTNWVTIRSERRLASFRFTTKSERRHIWVSSFERGA
jgi:hypothetical protein